MRAATRAAGLVGLCLVLALAGCSLRNPRTGAPAANPLDLTPPNSWVTIGPSVAALLQFTRAGQTIQGTLDVTTLEASSVDAPFDHVATDHSGFTGTIQGTSITLNFPQGLGFGATVSGSIDSARLALNFPDGAGSMAALTFTPGGVDKFNEGVAALQATLAKNAAGS